MDWKSTLLAAVKVPVPEFEDHAIAAARHSTAPKFLHFLINAAVRNLVDQQNESRCLNSVDFLPKEVRAASERDKKRAHVATSVCSVSTRQKNPAWSCFHCSETQLQQTVSSWAYLRATNMALVGT